MDWNPPTESLSDDEILDKFGAVWLNEHREKVRNEDGSVVIHAH